MLLGDAELWFALAFLGALWIKVPNHHLLVPITLFAFITITGPYVIFHLNMKSGFYFAYFIFGALGLIFSYVMRYRKKEPKRLIDDLKLFAVMMLPIVTLVWWSGYAEIQPLVAYFIMVSIYVYDRLVLRNG